MRLRPEPARTGDYAEEPADAKVNRIWFAKACKTIATLALAAIGALTLFLRPLNVQGDDGQDRAAAGEWIYLAALVLGTVGLLLIVAILRRRNVNPHTGLHSTTKRRRARRPFKRGGPT